MNKKGLLGIESWKSTCMRGRYHNFFCHPSRQLTRIVLGPVRHRTATSTSLRHSSHFDHSIKPAPHLLLIGRRTASRFFLASTPAPPTTNHISRPIRRKSVVYVSALTVSPLTVENRSQRHLVAQRSCVPSPVFRFTSCQRRLLNPSDVKLASLLQPSPTARSVTT
ncbi:hypothetical protein VTJ04DRAFT_701 [Mycothermus thermophilus]|uniref:uncharacterized protein n=1 Tax=Humicola insolens TaxID=85995 RepID=UPI00374224EE